MKTTLLVTLLCCSTPALMAASSPLTGPGQSNWTVKKGDKDVGKIALFTDGSNVRAEWKASSSAPAIVFLGTGGKAWVRTASGDIEVAGYKGGVERAVVPALLVPFVASSADKVSYAGGKASSLVSGATKASYKHDSKGAVSVDLSSGGSSYVITRTSIGNLPSDGTLFTVKPKKSTALRMAKLSGDLLGGSDSSVSATAGGRGVGKGTGFADGGDYAALEKIESRNDAWKKTLQKDLSTFQKSGKVGKSKESGK